jgi:hypothetical protein
MNGWPEVGVRGRWRIWVGRGLRVWILRRGRIRIAIASGRRRLRPNGKVLGTCLGEGVRPNSGNERSRDEKVP